MTPRQTRAIGLDQPWWQASTNREGLAAWPDEDLGQAWCAAARWPERVDARTARANVEAELTVRDPDTMAEYMSRRTAGRPPVPAMTAALTAREQALSECLEPLRSAAAGNWYALGMCQERQLWQALSAAAVSGDPRARTLAQVARAGLAERGSQGIDALDNLSAAKVADAVRAAGWAPFPATFSAPAWRDIAAGNPANSREMDRDQRWWASANHEQGVTAWSDEDLGAAWCACVSWPTHAEAGTARAVIEAELMVRDPQTMADYTGRAATGAPPQEAMSRALQERGNQLDACMAPLRAAQTGADLGLHSARSIWRGMSAASVADHPDLVVVGERELRDRRTPGIELLDRADPTSINRAARSGGWPVVPALFSATSWQPVTSGQLAAAIPAATVIDVRTPARTPARAAGQHPAARQARCPAVPARGVRR